MVESTMLASLGAFERVMELLEEMEKEGGEALPMSLVALQ